MPIVCRDQITGRLKGAGQLVGQPAHLVTQLADDLRRRQLLEWLRAILEASIYEISGCLLRDGL